MFGLIEKLEVIAKHENSKVLYVLALIALAMMIDFILGYLGARMRNEVISKKGIDGILRKIASILMLIFVIPLAPIIPGGAGVAALYVLYIGYLMLEVTSIIENYKKISGNDATLLMKFFGMLNEEKKEEDKHE